MQEISIANYFPQAVVHMAAKQGLDPQVLLKRAKIPAKLFSQLNARVTAEQYAALQTITMREMNDEMLGYTQSPLKVGSWSIVCHWMISCRNLNQALKRFCHFYSLTEKGMQLTLKSKSDTLSIQLKPWKKNQRVEPYGYEILLFAIHRICCWLVEDNIPIQQVHLPYPSPSHAKEYQPMFQSRSIFDRDDCRLIFDSQIKTMPIKQTTESLTQFLKQPLLNILVNDYNQKSWTAKTKAALREHLIDIPNLIKVAQTLDILPNKLRKELLAEGIHYNDLKGQVRYDAAISFLTKTNKPIEDIAYQVGFSETSTFTRAFKRWTGITPFKYRKLDKESRH